MCYMTFDQQVKELYKREGRQEGKQEIIKLLENNRDKTISEILDLIENLSISEPESQT